MSGNISAEAVEASESNVSEEIKAYFAREIARSARSKSSGGASVPRQPVRRELPSVSADYVSTKALLGIAEEEMSLAVFSQELSQSRTLCQVQRDDYAAVTSTASSGLKNACISIPPSWKQSVLEIAGGQGLIGKTEIISGVQLKKLPSMVESLDQRGVIEVRNTSVNGGVGSEVRAVLLGRGLVSAVEQHKQNLQSRDVLAGLQARFDDAAQDARRYMAPVSVAGMTLKVSSELNGLAERGGIGFVSIKKGSYDVAAFVMASEALQDLREFLDAQGVDLGRERGVSSSVMLKTRHHHYEGFTGSEVKICSISARNNERGAVISRDFAAQVHAFVASRVLEQGLDGQDPVEPEQLQALQLMR